MCLDGWMDGWLAVYKDTLGRHYKGVPITCAHYPDGTNVAVTCRYCD